ncbi:MAG: sulfite exporter TauE/SafE family protein [Anaerolineaceae bacterium]
MENILIYVVVGFVAQIIDGSLGMAYGVSANSFLLASGLSPVAASASVHAAEIVTTLISGISHAKFGNIDRRIVLRLLIPGVIGGGVGAYILTSIDGDKIKPYITIYLLIMGIRILTKAFTMEHEHEREPKTPLLVALGLVGGTMDAIGGGGWGPVVTSTLISTGHSPRKTIGSVNFSEFFVTLTESIVFIVTIGLTNWHVILGLLIGGILAAPLGAMLTRKLSVKVIMLMVGTLIVLLQLRTLYMLWF